VRNVPLVFVDVGPARPRVSNIRIDYLHGIRQAVQHLAALRHERIAFITGPLSLKSAVARKSAFLQSMEEIGLAALPELVIEGDHTLEGGMCALANLLAVSIPPTAVVCSNDMTAIGVMRQSYEERISIPRDLSVVGFDDIRLAQFVLLRSPACACRSRNWHGWRSTHCCRMCSARPRRRTGRSMSSKPVWCCGSPPPWRPGCRRGRRAITRPSSEN